MSINPSHEVAMAQCIEMIEAKWGHHLTPFEVMVAKAAWAIGGLYAGQQAHEHIRKAFNDIDWKEKGG